MILVGRLVQPDSFFFVHIRIKNVMNGGHDLLILKRHFNCMSVKVVVCCLSEVRRKIKDVHILKQKGDNCPLIVPNVVYLE